jgi:hypothetical protein
VSLLLNVTTNAPEVLPLRLTVPTAAFAPAFSPKLTGLILRLNSNTATGAISTGAGMAKIAGLGNGGGGGGGGLDQVTCRHTALSPRSLAAS